MAQGDTSSDENNGFSLNGTRNLSPCPGNPYATKGFLQRSPFSNAQVRTGAIRLPIPASAGSADGQPEPHPPA
jgi:hypothetical protein